MSNSIDSPNYESEEYRAFLDVLALPEALMGGTDAMRAAGTIFLPQEEGESKDAYNSRVARSFLFGGFERTIGILTGEVFNKPVAVKEDSPDYGTIDYGYDYGAEEAPLSASYSESNYQAPVELAPVKETNKISPAEKTNRMIIVYITIGGVLVAVAVVFIFIKRRMDNFNKSKCGKE